MAVTVPRRSEHLTLVGQRRPVEPAPLPHVARVLTPAQLDAALDAASWPTWTGRDSAREACPLSLAPVPPAGHALARRCGVTVPPTCLRVDPVVEGGDWQMLLVELAVVAPAAILDVMRRELVLTEPVQGEGTARYLLGIEVGL